MIETKPCPQVYFDCNATTPVLPAAAKAALEAMSSLYGNPSSPHLIGIRAKAILETTRSRAAAVIGTDSEQIVFTSGATEALQVAVFSALCALKEKNSVKKNKILYGATEHKAVSLSLTYWAKVLGLTVDIRAIPVDEGGQLNLSFLEQELNDTFLLCTMAVNNETGVIQNNEAIQKLLLDSQSEVLWIVDCVQALGKIKLQLNSSRMDYAAFSGHKLYAPKGSGFLWTRKGAPLFPLSVGGGQENGFRAGTENLPGVAALGVVLEELLMVPGESVFQPHAELVKFRDQLVGEIKKSFPRVVFNSPLDQTVPTTLNFSVPGFCSRELLEVFDSAGLRLSAGSACNSTSVTPSHVLLAMGLPEWRASSALRLSFGPYTQQAEIDQGCQLIRDCALALQSTCLMPTPFRFEAPLSLREGIIQFRSGASNSWILVHGKSRNCVVIDPCESVAEKIENYIVCQKLNVLAVLDTHSHADHDSIRPLLQQVLQPYFLTQGPQEKSQEITNKNNLKFDSLGWPDSDYGQATEVILGNGTKVPAIQFYRAEGNLALQVGVDDSEESLVLAKFPTPGHTQDSQAFFFGMMKNGHLRPSQIQFAFCGDTLLSGGLGRTNFPSSDPVSLFDSLRSLQEILSPTTLICPSHDYTNSFATCLKTETQENALLALALGPLAPSVLESFVQKKRELDLGLKCLEESFQAVVCGVTQNPLSHKNLDQDLDPSISWASVWERLDAAGCTLVDVREPQEYSLFKSWESLGIKKAPRNVPLSRFVNFMAELLVAEKKSKEVVLLCRSGNRSAHAAQSLRRLGFKSVWSVTGGLSASVDPIE